MLVFEIQDGECGIVAGKLYVRPPGYTRAIAAPEGARLTQNDDGEWSAEPDITIDGVTYFLINGRWAKVV